MPLSPPPSSASTFPVVFFDGNRNFDAGVVSVSGSTDINGFLSAVSRAIGAPPSEISTSLVRRNKIPRRIPINDFSNFKEIGRERDCFVVATMRQRPRRRGKKGWAPSTEKKEMTILKRNQERPPSVLEVWDYESRLRNLDLMRERFLMSTSSAIAMEYYAPSPRASWAATGGGFEFSPAATPTPPPSPLAKCDECLSAIRERRSPEFHLCVNDRVVAAFRTAVGPIERTVKKHNDGKNE